MRLEGRARTISPSYIAAGATGFGIGSYLYKPGATVVDIEARAKAVVAAYDTATAR